MKLYTCGTGTGMGSLGHPCGKAASALEEAGHTFEVEKVAGRRFLPWTMDNPQRGKLRELTGQNTAPVLELDDGTAIAGSQKIAEWAKANPASGA